MGRDKRADTRRRGHKDRDEDRRRWVLKNYTNTSTSAHSNSSTVIDRDRQTRLQTEKRKRGKRRKDTVIHSWMQIERDSRETNKKTDRLTERATVTCCICPFVSSVALFKYFVNHLGLVKSACGCCDVSVAYIVQPLWFIGKPTLFALSVRGRKNAGSKSFLWNLRHLSCVASHILQSQVLLWCLKACLLWVAYSKDRVM